jgi:four helix bundle protein
MLHKFDAFQVAKQFHWECKKLNLRQAIKDQLVRASSSIALTLAEGSGKWSPKDQRRYYTMAMGSLRECQAIFELEKMENVELTKLADRLGAMLFKLTRKTIKIKNGTD